MYVVLYNPGAGGNMVSAVIDSKDYILGNTDILTNPDSLRKKLITASFEENIKESELNPNNKHLDIDALDKKLNIILNEVDAEKKYTCIASHYFYYYIEKTNYKIILINDTEDEVSKWTLNRAIAHGHEIVHDAEMVYNRKNIIYELKSLKYSNRVVKTIDMRDILNGKLITILQEFIGTPLNEQLYKSWLHNNIK